MMLLMGQEAAGIAFAVTFAAVIVVGCLLGWWIGTRK